MKLRYCTLEQLRGRLQEHAPRIIAEHKKKPRILSSARQGGPRAPPATPLTPTSQTQDFPRGAVAVNGPPPILGDHYVLYSIPSGGVVHPHDNPSRPLWMFDDYGNLNLRKLYGQGGGDFNRWEYVSSWTLEQATAEQFRKWAEHRSHHSETCIVRIQVLKPAIDSLRQEELWSESADWKSYVWHCRERRFMADMPPRFDKYYKRGRAQLTKGHICANLPGTLPRIKRHAEEEDIHAVMDEDDVLMTNGQKATQWVFMDACVDRELGEAFNLGSLIRGRSMLIFTQDIKDNERDMYPSGFKIKLSN